jgi:hypothetical protein
MANGHGGKRVGAGAKKKGLADNLLDGNPGKRPLKVIEFNTPAELQGRAMPKPREFLSGEQNDSIPQLQAIGVYEQTWQWLSERKCDHLVMPQLIEQYAMSVARWIQCEECISEFGFLSKHPTTGKAQMSPFVTAGQSFMKQANTLWFTIYQVVRENCATEYSGTATPHDDVMERLLNIKHY